MQTYLHVQYLITGKKPSVSQEAFLFPSLLMKVSLASDNPQVNTGFHRLILLYEKDIFNLVRSCSILLPNE